MSARILSFYDYDRERSISCPCGWSGICSENEDYFREVLDVRCAKCDRMLLIVEYPTHAQTRAAAAEGHRQAIKDLESVNEREAFFARAAEHARTDPDQLPDLEGDDLVIEWDFEDGERKDHGPSAGDSWTILRHGDRVIWREVAFYEGLYRFEEVMWILREKYGTRLAELRPTADSDLYLCGDDIRADSKIKSLNADLERFRETVGKGDFIDVPDADGEAGDPERQEIELLAAVAEMGMIDCPCGWEDDATEATVRGSGASRDLHCPECRRPLFQVNMDGE